MPAWGMASSITHFALWFLAYFRLSRSAVCAMSRGKEDYHDYKDEDDLAPPMHDYTYHCSRCGKAFTI